MRNVQEDVQTVGLKSDVYVTLQKKTYLWLFGYNEDKIDVFVQNFAASHEGTKIIVEGLNFSSQISQSNMLFVQAAYNEGTNTTLKGLSLPTQNSQPKWLEEATTNIGQQTNFHD